MRKFGPFFSPADVHILQTLFSKEKSGKFECFEDLYNASQKKKKEIHERCCLFMGHPNLMPFYGPINYCC